MRSSISSRSWCTSTRSSTAHSQPPRWPMSETSTLHDLHEASGKVRELYGFGDRLLLVASDRMSAFDVVLPTPIPDKGRVLTGLSRVWFERTAGVALVGEERFARIEQLSIALYRAAADYALERGIIIADTKFEFGEDAAGRIVVGDEVLTPDSSRFWPVD